MKKIKNSFILKWTLLLFFNTSIISPKKSNGRIRLEGVLLIILALYNKRLMAVLFWVGNPPQTYPEIKRKIV
jgi:hypothetical protein